MLTVGLHFFCTTSSHLLSSQTIQRIPRRTSADISNNFPFISSSCRKQNQPTRREGARDETLETNPTGDREAFQSSGGTIRAIGERGTGMDFIHGEGVAMIEMLQETLKVNTFIRSRS